MLAYTEQPLTLTTSNLAVEALSVEALEDHAPVELGDALLEVDVPPRAGTSLALVEVEPIEDSVSQLRKEGHSITWVSLAAAEVSDEKQVAIRTSRLANAGYLLKQVGIDGTRISTVEAAADVVGGGVRLRFLDIEEDSYVDENAFSNFCLAAQLRCTRTWFWARNSGEQPFSSGRP